MPDQPQSRTPKPSSQRARPGSAWLMCALGSLLGMVSEAPAQTLSVSAENALRSNQFVGAQVIEVVVTDPDIADTTIPQLEPDVTVNGSDFRMVQATDGSWYGYLAQRAAAVLADSTAPAEGTAAAGNGLDFGTFCDSASGVALGLSALGIADSEGVAIPRDLGVDGGTAGAPIGGPITHHCATLPTGSPFGNVLREPPTPAPFPTPGVDVGQIGIDAAAWPFVQLYDLPIDDVVSIQYNDPGSPEQVDLVYVDDMDLLVDWFVDRPSGYPRNAEVHLTIDDFWLNVDPTDEDSWTFASNAAQSASAGTYYAVFDEQGNPAGDAVVFGVVNLETDLAALGCGDNCRLFLDADPSSVGTPILTLQDNEITALTGTLPEDPISFSSPSGQLPVGSQPITVVETGPNTGIFTTTDPQLRSTLRVSADAPRGSVGNLEYNLAGLGILVRNYFGFLGLLPVNPTWGGEPIGVQLQDVDLDKNGLAADQLKVSDPRVEHIPSLVIGQPVTLEDLASATLQPAGIPLFGFVPGAEDVELASQRAFLRTPVGSGIAVVDGDQIQLDLGMTFQQLYSTLPVPGSDSQSLGPNGFRGLHLVNFDLRSLFAELGVGLADLTISVTDGTDTVPIASNVGGQGLVDLADQALAATPGFFDLDPLQNALVVLTLNTSGPLTLPGSAVMPIVFDIFSFGFQEPIPPVVPAIRVADMIARLELEESGPNSGFFEGDIAFQVSNQLSVLDPQAYLNLVPIGKQATFVIASGATGAAAPNLEYEDVDNTGSISVLQASEAAPTHTGAVSFDAALYDASDTVTITLDDRDLNTQASALDTYGMVATPHEGDPAFATVGAPGLPDVFFGPLGVVLELQIDGVRWRTPQGSCNLAGPAPTGFDASGFALVETGADTGIFQGSFQVPSLWCRSDDGSPEPTGGLPLTVHYLDFVNAAGGLVETVDTAQLPEPDGLTMLLAGIPMLKLLAAARRRQRTTASAAPSRQQKAPPPN